MLEWQDHNNENTGWHDIEADIVLATRHNPRGRNAFWFDDTESTGFPKWTKCPMKNLSTTRFHMIPFLIADLA